MVVNTLVHRKSFPRLSYISFLAQSFWLEYFPIFRTPLQNSRVSPSLFEVISCSQGIFKHWEQFCNTKLYSKRS